MVTIVTTVVSTELDSWDSLIVGDPREKERTGRGGRTDAAGISQLRKTSRTCLNVVSLWGREGKKPKY